MPLGVVLRYPHGAVLPNAWHLDYGITPARNHALLGSPKNPNSFTNPRSEPALTLFVLGNIDDWKQVGAFPNGPPRNLNNDWDAGVFEGIRNGHVGAAQGAPLWAQLPVAPFNNQGLDFATSVLLFEFRVLNNAFNSHDDQAFSSLSFLNIEGYQNWAQFDAFLIVQRAERTENDPGTLIGFECKLSSDISREH